MHRDNPSNDLSIAQNTNPSAETLRGNWWLQVYLRSA